jgi:hypothetical protein
MARSVLRCGPQATGPVIGPDRSHPHESYRGGRHTPSPADRTTRPAVDNVDLHRRSMVLQRCTTLAVRRNIARRLKHGDPHPRTGTAKGSQSVREPFWVLGFGHTPHRCLNKLFRTILACRNRRPRPNSVAGNQGGLGAGSIGSDGGPARRSPPRSAMM